ncbi:MAG: Hsp33 family molecular chaperone HslO [Leptospira sp.]|nr:Hsp33 family molecular chaperone HslO [Leptospira sp.]
MTDQVILGIVPQNHFRFSIAELTNTANDITTLHNLNREMSVFLSKTMLGALFLAEMTKNQQRVSIQWKDETNKSALAYSDRYGRIKAVAYGDMLEEGDIRNEFILGQGIMKVIRWQYDSDFYQSFTNLIEDTFEFNFLKYLGESEQVRSIVGMDVENKTLQPINNRVKGVMFEALPEATDEDFDFIKSKIEPLFQKELFWNQSLEEMKTELSIALASELIVLSTEEPAFICDCSRFKVSEIILSLGRIEADSIVDEFGQVEITCEFCKKAYQFNQEDVATLFQDE